jgi:hypothetical protein
MEQERQQEAHFRCYIDLGVGCATWLCLLPRSASSDESSNEMVSACCAVEGCDTSNLTSSPSSSNILHDFLTPGGSRANRPSFGRNARFQNIYTKFK